jgi:hypothetical protein
MHRKPYGTTIDLSRCPRLAELSSAACPQPSEGLPFRIAAGLVLATLLFQAGGANSSLRNAASIGGRMATESSSSNQGSKLAGFKLALDTWAVILALLLALAVRLGLFHKIPW